MKINIAIQDCSPEALALVAQFVAQVREYGVEVSSPEVTQGSAEPQLADALTLEQKLDKQHPRLSRLMRKKTARAVSEWSDQQKAWVEKVLATEPSKETLGPARAFKHEMGQAEWGKAMMFRILEERVVAGLIPCHPHILASILHYIYPMKRVL